jgi:hypothetical protein
MQSQVTIERFRPGKVLRYPRLDTVIMVEKFVRRHSGEYTKKQLWERLPRKMMYQTFSTIVDYLEYSNKIIKDRDGKLVWTWDPEKVRELLGRGLVVR